MSQLFQQFYVHQDEIVNTLNQQVQYFQNKIVDITIKSERGDRTYPGVMLSGYTHEAGFLYLNWIPLKKDGTPSKHKVNATIFDDYQVIIVLHKNIDANEN